MVRSLVEAREELPRFFRFPKSQWKCLCTANAIERLHEEFRHQIKAQASLPNGSGVLRSLFGLYESRQIPMRRIDGWKDIAKAVALPRPKSLREGT